MYSAWRGSRSARRSTETQPPARAAAWPACDRPPAPAEPPAARSAAPSFSSSAASTTSATATQRADGLAREPRRQRRRRDTTTSASVTMIPIRAGARRNVKTGMVSYNTRYRPGVGPERGPEGERRRSGRRTPPRRGAARVASLAGPAGVRSRRDPARRQRQHDREDAREQHLAVALDARQPPAVGPRRRGQPGACRWRGTSRASSSVRPKPPRSARECRAGKTAA